MEARRQSCICITHLYWTTIFQVSVFRIQGISVDECWGTEDTEVHLGDFFDIIVKVWKTNMTG